MLPPLRPTRSAIAKPSQVRNTSPAKHASANQPVRGRSQTLAGHTWDTTTPTRSRSRPRQSPALRVPGHRQPRAQQGPQPLDRAVHSANSSAPATTLHSSPARPSTTGAPT